MSENIKFHYRVESSHWTKRDKDGKEVPWIGEFCSEISMDVGECFRILKHNGERHYPTRFKVVAKSLHPFYSGRVVEIEELVTHRQDPSRVENF